MIVQPNAAAELAHSPFSVSVHLLSHNTNLAPFFLYHSHYLTTPAKGSRFHHMLPHITALSHSALSLTPLAFQADTLLTSNTQSQVSPRIVGLLRTPLCL